MTGLRGQAPFSLEAWLTKLERGADEAEAWAKDIETLIDAGAPRSLVKQLVDGGHRTAPAARVLRQRLKSGDVSPWPRTVRDIFDA